MQFGIKLSKSDRKIDLDNFKPNKTVLLLVKIEFLFSFKNVFSEDQREQAMACTKYSILAENI